MTDPVPDARPPTGHPKIGPAHLGRAAVVYVRQSTPAKPNATSSPATASTRWWNGPWSWAGPAVPWR
jgi:hypothetical protein